jgi:hypothetical protein
MHEAEKRIDSRSTPIASALLAGAMICTAGLPAASAHAQQAVVRSYDAPVLEVGQAWLVRSGERCLALMPYHVAKETSVPSLLREGSEGLRGEASSVSDLGDDAAVAVMTGSITRSCGYALGGISRHVERHLRDGGLGALRAVNGDGTLGRLPVAVVDDDGQTFLRVLPTNERERIRKGHSGSLLVVNDQPVGMLLAVHARTGVGTVMRTDALLAKVETHLRGATPAPPALDAASTTATVQDSPPGPAPSPVAAVGPWRVQSWSADPVGSAHLASRLVASGDEGYWAARTESWPVALELGGPDAVRIVRGLSFRAGVDLEPAQRPSRVQVLVSVAAEGTAWRSVTSGTLQYAEGEAKLEFLPVRARRVRIEIYDSQGDPAHVALSRLRVLEP